MLGEERTPETDTDARHITAVFRSTHHTGTEQLLWDPAQPHFPSVFLTPADTALMAADSRD